MHARFQMPPDTPPHLNKIYALVVLAIFACAGSVWQMGRDWVYPPPAWMIGARRWYNDVLAFLGWVSVGAACVAYLRYRRRLSRDGVAATPRPWQQRRDVRLVLFVVAATLFAQLPLAAYQTVVALHDPKRPSFAEDVVMPSIMNGVVPALAGVAILVYDRRRLTREERIAGNLCMSCGYDLRATPERCPECGAVDRGSAI